MTKFEDEYYILCPDYSQQSTYNIIKADQATSKRRFHYRELISGGKPAFFESKDNTWVTKSLSLLLFVMPSIVIHKDLTTQIDERSIFGGKYFPAVYVDESGEYLENYYLLNIFNKLDCWCRANSEYEQQEPDDTPHVIKYKLDQNTLEKIDENERLIFKMGGVDLPKIFVHRKIIAILKEAQVRGFKAIKVADYELGMEF